eukprot:TRINITY_DN744_c0_g1_i4.p1 TRINITY_DN744_c0_g1~~TRINITY_DN744_c0_g1_i4.p1  ORF type:complete len:413 (-),score=51.78 TRINITY_DN744_c0_g1_i4:604-1842(-)
MQGTLFLGQKAYERLPKGDRLYRSHHSQCHHRIDQQSRKSKIVLAQAPKGKSGPDYTSVARNLALELVRVTEAAALAAGKWVGKGDKIKADQAAVDQMRAVLNSIEMEGVVVIGEGEKDEAPMLYRGERLGTGHVPQIDIAVDPLDGTTLVAQGRDGAVSVIALAEKGALFNPGPCMYMEKLAVGPKVPANTISLNQPVSRNLEIIGFHLGKPVSDVTVLILDRPRHEELIRQCREAGARIKLISDGDVGGAIETAKEASPVDVLIGIGGTPEGVVAAAALKCMGGSIQGKLWPRSEAEKQAALDQGYDLDKILMTDDLCNGEEVFFAATGVTDGDLLRGVRYYSGGASTNSIVMRSKSGTIRYLESYHRWDQPSLTNVPQAQLGIHELYPTDRIPKMFHHNIPKLGDIISK